MIHAAVGVGKNIKIKNEAVERLPEAIDAEIIATIIDQMDNFIASKYLLFPDINYFVVDYNLSFDGHGNYTLDVNSTEKCSKDQ